MTERKVIGIDFGSSQSSVAIMEIGSTKRPELLDFSGGGHVETLPTVVALDENDDSIVLAIGDDVRNLYKDHRSSADGVKFVSDFKRYLGGGEVRESDPPDVSDAKKHADKYAKIFLGELLQRIKKHFGVDTLNPEDYETCVAYPASWEDDCNQKRGVDRVARLKELVKEVGFPSDKIFGIYAIAEPVAAMQSLRMQEALRLHFSPRPEYFMVIDFGGGTLDICIVRTESLGKNPVIVSKSGKPELGGREFDDIIYREFFKQHKERIRPMDLTSAAERDLRDQIKVAKETYSDNFRTNESQILPFELPQGPLKLELFRQHFYNLCDEREIQNNILLSIREALKKAGITFEEISKVILTGGSSRWPFVREIVAKEFPLCGDEIFLTDTPFTDVANGCAIFRGLPNGPEKKKGVWVRWKLLGEENWSDPKPLVEVSSDSAVGMEVPQFLGQIQGTKYLTAYTICLSWYRGDSVKDLVQDGQEARISVFARGNFPHFQRIKGAVQYLRGEMPQRIEDTYDLYLRYRIGEGGTCRYTFEILDREAAEVERVRWSKREGEGPEKADKMPQGTRESIKIGAGDKSYRGFFGFMKRKRVDEEK